MVSNVIEVLYNPFTVLEAITLAKMSLVNAFTYNRLLNIRCVAIMVHVHSVIPLLIENPLSNENNNNRCFLENVITFKLQGFFTTPHITDFASYGK